MDSYFSSEVEFIEPTNLLRRRSHQLRLQQNIPNNLVIKVLSSKNNVSVIIDNTVVSTDIILHRLWGAKSSIVQRKNIYKFIIFFLLNYVGIESVMRIMFSL